MLIEYICNKAGKENFSVGWSNHNSKVNATESTPLQNSGLQTAPAERSNNDINEIRAEYFGDNHNHQLAGAAAAVVPSITLTVPPNPEALLIDVISEFAQIGQITNQPTDSTSTNSTDPSVLSNIRHSGLPVVERDTSGHQLRMGFEIRSNSPSHASSH